MYRVCDKRKLWIIGILSADYHFTNHFIFLLRLLSRDEFLIAFSFLKKLLVVGVFTSGHTNEKCKLPIYSSSTGCYNLNSYILIFPFVLRKKRKKTTSLQIGFQKLLLKCSIHESHLSHYFPIHRFDSFPWNIYFVSIKLQIC